MPNFIPHRKKYLEKSKKYGKYINITLEGSGSIWQVLNFIFDMQHMGFIRLRTGIPGPRSRALMKKKERALPSGIDCSVPVFIRRADGALVHDVDGNTLLDFSCG